MKLKIPLIIRMLPSGEIEAIQPQFKYQEVFPISTSNEKIYQKLFPIINEKIKASMARGEQLPEIIKKKYYIRKKEYRFVSWMYINVNVDYKNQLCEILLPKVGHISNVISLLGNTLSALMSIRLTATGTNEITQWSIGVPAGIFNFLILLIIYIYSGSSNMLRKIGHLIDNKISKNPSEYEIKNFEQETQEISNQGSSYKKIFVGISAGFCILFLQVLTAIDTYQDIMSKGLRLGINKSDEAYKLMLILAWTTMISTAFSSTVFQGSFAKDFIQDLTSNKDEDDEKSEYPSTAENLIEQQEEFPLIPANDRKISLTL